MERATIERAIAGDQDAFARIAAASIRSMYATARLIVREDSATLIGSTPGCTGCS